VTRVRYARSGDVDVAYDVVGDGPIDLVYVEGAYTHLEVSWELPAYRHFCERLAEFTRLIRFDKRGMGMSDRVPGSIGLDERMDDIRAVLDAAGSERAAVMGQGYGTPIAALFAATYPERTSALVLYSPVAKTGLKTDDYPWASSRGDATNGGSARPRRGGLKSSRPNGWLVSRRALRGMPGPSTGWRA
jgi:pimeloyl-ACP methyl ester carboxylesterase